MNAPAPVTVLLFPGQGAHEPTMLEVVRRSEHFSMRYAAVCQALGFDPIDNMAEQINRNRVSSLLTVLVSRLMLDELELESPPRAMAGYSVGQWMAMHAAGMLSFEDLLRVLVKRCELMDQCAQRYSGGMIAVIGLALDVVEGVCEKYSGAQVVNLNCIGQYSISAPEAAIEPIMSQLEQLKPKRLVRLPVAGPWHSSLLREAEEPFATFLDTLTLNSPSMPVIDNTTGQVLPAEPRQQLARHISHPVCWESGIRTLISMGCNDLLEVGYGNVLTKFGFFIDRSVTHRAMHDPRRPVPG